MTSRARVLATALLLVTPVLALAPRALAQAPADTGWWSFAAREGLPKPPPPPDVQDGDLLVQAGDPTGLSAGGAQSTPAPSAVAALRFAVPAGSTLGPLTLTVASGGTAMDVRAYATRDPWTPAYGAPLSQAPQPDTTSFSQGVLEADGVHLRFADIARVAPESGPLSIVLVPGGTDRVVVRKPDATVLTVQPGRSATSDATAPPPAATSPDAPPPALPGAGVAGPGTADCPAASGFDSGTAGSFDSGTAGSFDSGPPPQAPAPELGAAPAPTVAEPRAAGLPQTVRPVSSVVPGLSDDRTRYFAVAEALLVLVTFGLLGWGPFARLASLTGNAPAEVVQRPRGVGRFTAERRGRPAKL